MSIGNIVTGLGVLLLAPSAAAQGNVAQKNGM